MTEINKNMVRDRALKLPVVTDEMYNMCNAETREMIQIAVLNAFNELDD